MVVVIVLVVAVGLFVCAAVGDAAAGAAPL